MSALIRAAVCPALFFFAVICAAPDLATAEETKSLEHHIELMLNEGWSVKPSSRADAEQHFRDALAIASGDTRLYVARSLALTKQRRYDLAAEAWRRLAEKNPENLEFLVWKIRVGIVSKEHASALVDLVALAQRLPETSTDPEIEAAATLRANFLGRMFGYLDGPGAEVAKLPENHRSEARRKVVAALSPERQQAFEEGRAAVTDRFAAFQMEQEKEVEQSRRQQEVELQQRSQLLGAEQARVTNELQNLQNDLREIRKDQRDEIRDIDRDLDRVQSDLSRYEGRLISAQREIQLYRNDINRLIIALDAEEDPVRRSLLRDDLRRLELLLSRRDADYRVQEREAFRVNDQRISLERERQRVGNLYEDQADDVERRVDTVRKMDRKLRNEMLEVQRPPSGVNSRVRYLRNKSAAFTTYDQFPLESQKAAMLKSLREN